jgi:hypothetical protein
VIKTKILGYGKRLPETKKRRDGKWLTQNFGVMVSIAQPFTAGNKSGHEPRYKGRSHPFSLIKFRRFDLNF